MNPLAELVGQSPAIGALREKIWRLVKLPSGTRRAPPILIQGETGTGKGLVARAIHRAGPRRDAAFVDVNCAAIPEALLEAEMFGHERGAFTDARQARAGLFQTAHRGTIFLDEIGLLPEALQAKLLKVIEEQSIRRLGSTHNELVDVWTITATSEDLAAAAHAHRFREDLYQRLAVLTVWVPPLRERGEDILLLAEHFLTRACADYQLPGKELDARARAALLAYAWPGNVRELSNLMERVAVLSEAPVVTAEMLGLPGTSGPRARTSGRTEERVSLDDALRDHVLEALRQTSWNISRAAAQLGISRNTLRSRIEKHGLSPGTPAPSRTGRTPRAATPPVPKGPEVRPGPGVGAAVAGRWEPRRLTVLRAAVGTPGEPGSLLSTSRALEVCVEKVRSFGGRIEEMGAQGLVAAFGQEPVEDAPRRACHAAMAIHNAAERAARAEEKAVPVKVGIHVGQFLVGVAPGGPEIDLDAKRQAWTVLEALIARGEPATTVVSDAAASFLERRFDLVPLGGLGQVPGQAYRLGRRERTGLKRKRRMVDFVGRQADLELLKNRLAAALEGHGQVVGIVGEAGIGKSRLLYEFRRSLRGKDILFLEARCLSYGSAIPYFPVLDFLRRNFGIAETDPPEAIADKVRTGFRLVEMAPEEHAPYALQLLGVREGADRLAALPPETIKNRTFDTLRQLCLKGSRRQPMVLVLEDAQWIDKTSEECVSSIVGTIAGAPVLFLCTCRPGYQPPWMDKSYATQVALQPLLPRESLSVVQSVLQTEQIPEPIVQFILARAEGNPFYLEELTRAVAEQGGLRLTEVVPETIQEVILARIHRLADEPKQLLQTAAVLGREVSPRLLSAIWEGPGVLDPHLRELMRLEFLYERPRAAEPFYVFKHALTQEVAYESLLPARRRALHTAAGRAFEQMYADRLEEVHDRLAHHYAKTDDAAKAVEYLTQVAAKAARAHAHAEAVNAVREALVHVERLPAKQREPQLFTLILRQGASLIPLGRIPEILELLLQKAEGVGRLEDSARVGRYYFQLGRVYSFLGEHERAAQCAQQAIEEAKRSGDDGTVGKAFFILALEALFSGTLRQGIEHGVRAVELLERTDEPWWVGSAYWVIGLNHSMLGAFEQALAAHARARTIGEATGDARLQSLPVWGAGIIRSAMGEWEAGIEACRQALDLAPDPLHTALASGWLGFAYLEKGDAAQAMALLEPAVRQFGEYEFRPMQAWFTSYLAEARLLNGDMPGARELALRALDLSHEARFCYGAACAQRTLGRIASSSGAPAEAARHLQEALATFESVQARYDLGRTRLDLATLAHTQGDHPAAAAHRDEARRVFEELRVPGYAERASPSQTSAAG